jgi:hypothetical protein
MRKERMEQVGMNSILHQRVQKNEKRNKVLLSYNS